MSTKVLFHIDDNKNWDRIILFVGAFLDNQPDANVVVVANGTAVNNFSRLEVHPFRAAKINGLAERGARFVCSAHALEIHQIDEDGLPDGVSVVPSGIFEMARLQSEGYAYIKA